MFIMACGPTDSVCGYKSTTEIFETQARCEMIGHIVGGGLMAGRTVAALGGQDRGTVQVTCKHLVDPVRLTDMILATTQAGTAR